MYNVGLEEHRNSAVLTCAANSHYSIQSQACDHGPRFVSCCACVFFSSTLGIASRFISLSSCRVNSSAIFCATVTNNSTNIQERQTSKSRALIKALQPLPYKQLCSRYCYCWMGRISGHHRSTTSGGGHNNTITKNCCNMMKRKRKKKKKKKINNNNNKI